MNIIGAKPLNPVVAFQHAKNELSHSLLTPAEQAAVQTVFQYVEGLEAVVVNLRSRLANEPSAESVNRMLAAAVMTMGNPAKIQMTVVDALPTKMHLDIDVAADFVLLTVKDAATDSAPVPDAAAVPVAGPKLVM